MIARHQAAHPGDGTLWDASVLVIAEPRYDESRETRGIYDYPPLVGPFVGFGFRVEWAGLAPAKGLAEAGPPKEANPPR